ncbi:hypothetical protein quinque_013954 [Culex quinquefasciatus]
MLLAIWLTFWHRIETEKKTRCQLGGAAPELNGQRPNAPRKHSRKVVPRFVHASPCPRAIRSSTIGVIME